MVNYNLKKEKNVIPYEGKRETDTSKQINTHIFDSQMTDN